jgi:purine-nucleoside phosphorylase
VVDATLADLRDGAYGAELDRRISEATDSIRSRLADEPSLASPKLVIVLGSGLGGVEELLDPSPRVTIAYEDIPNVPTSSIAGHAGRLVAGTVHGVPAVLLSGRAHPYEGFSHRESTLLLRAVIALGPTTVVLTNAAGGLNPEFEPGDVMLIADHINLSGDNPLRGPNLDRFGERFPALADAYDPALRAAAKESSTRTGIALREGVYIMLAGPSFETRAEMRMLRDLGGDAVGMSTAYETIVARHAGVRVLAFSLVTNKATEDVAEGATHQEVLAMGRVGGERLVTLLGDLLPRLG